MTAIMQREGNSFNLSNPHDDKTDCCDDPQIFTNIDGSVLCRSCGTVIGNEFVQQERNAYTREEVLKRRQTEVPWSRFANQTFFDNHYNNTFYRLNKINRYITGFERSQIEGEKVLKRIASMINIAPCVKDTASIILGRSMQKRLAMGRSIPGLAAASIILASRIHAYPIISIDDVLKANPGITHHGIIASIRLIKENIIPGLGFHIKQARDIEIRDLIIKFGTALEMSTSVQLKAIALFKSACVAGYGKYIIGKSPISIATALLYVAGDCAHGRRFSMDHVRQEQLCETCGTTSVTLRNQVKSLMDFLKKNKKVEKKPRLVEKVEKVEKVEDEPSLASDKNVEIEKKTITVSKAAMELILNVFKVNSSMLTAIEVSRITGTNINGTKAVIAALYKHGLLERVPVGNEMLFRIPE